MVSCFRGRAIQQWRKRAPGNHFHWRFLASLVFAGVLVALTGLLLPGPPRQPATNETPENTPTVDWEARLAEQAEVTAESREALHLLRQELERLREDYRALQARHEAQSRELEAAQQQLRSLRAPNE